MAVLVERGVTSQAELSRRTTIDRSDVVAAVNELSELGLVWREQDVSDRRHNVVSLAEGGEVTIDELGRVLADVQDTLLAPLVPGERDQLAGLLARLVTHHAR